LKHAKNETGVVVVIDVLRAFSTAAYAFAKGTKDIRLVSTIEEAFYWKEEIPQSLVMGSAGTALSRILLWKFSSPIRQLEFRR